MDLYVIILCASGSVDQIIYITTNTSPWAAGTPFIVLIGIAIGIPYYLVGTVFAPLICCGAMGQIFRIKKNPNNNRFFVFAFLVTCSGFLLVVFRNTLVSVLLH